MEQQIRKKPFLLKLIVKISKILEIISRKLMLLFMVVMVVLVMTNIATRYFIGQSIGSSYELSIHAYIYTVYLGTALALKDRVHPTMKYFYNKTSGSFKTLLIVLNYLFLVFLLVILAYFGYAETVDKWRVSAKMFNYSLGLIFFAVPLFAISSIFYLGEIIITAIYDKPKGDDKKWW